MSDRRTVIAAWIGAGGAIAAALIAALATWLMTPDTKVSGPPPFAKAGGKSSNLAAEPRIPPAQSASQRIASHLYEIWQDQHRELIERYGPPKSFKFLNLHEQHFKTGYIAYNVTDDWSFLLYPRTKEFRKLQNPGVHLTRGSGRRVNDKLFDDISHGLSDAQREKYRSLIDRRVKSPDFQGVGIIGGIGTLYVRERLFDAFGEPEENEKFIADVLHVRGDDYEVLVGLPHGLGLPDATSPRSVYFISKDDGRYERHVVWP